MAQKRFTMADCVCGCEEQVMEIQKGSIIRDDNWRWSWLFSNRTPNGIEWRLICPICCEDINPKRLEEPSDEDYVKAKKLSNRANDHTVK